MGSLYAASSTWIYRDAAVLLNHRCVGRTRITLLKRLIESGNSRSSQHSIAFNWSVSTYNFSQTAPQIYKFTIANDPTNVVDDVDSRTFNITTDSKAVSTSSTSATITITVPPSFTPNKGQTSSHTASTVGLGVGLGLGLPILMVLSTLLLILLRKRSAPQSTAVQPTVYTNIDTKTASLSTHDGRPGELNGSSSPVELPPPAQSLAEAPVEGNR